MTETARRIDPLMAKLPEFSADWRFLLPVRAHSRIVVLSDTWHDYAANFTGLGVQVVSCHIAGTPSPDNANERVQADGQPGSCLAAGPAQPPFAAGSFDAVVIPHGIPETMLPSRCAADPFRGLKWLLRPEGVLLLGFSNHWSIFRRGRRMGIAISPSSIRERLEHAGFGRFSLYGAVPNLDKPAYVLPLKKRPLRFFLHHRFLGRRGSGLLRLLPGSLVSRIVPGLLPGYFMVAGG